jgi:site-specific DNA-methyltransferase (adenine-specific)/modification methylase
MRLHFGDSKKQIKKIPKASIDLIFTDPPYNIAKYSTGNIKLPGRKIINNDLASWDLEEFDPHEWSKEFLRILKPKGNLLIFTSYNMLGKWHEALDAHFDTFQFAVWHKTNPVPKFHRSGFLNSCELIVICYNRGHTWNFTNQREMHNFFEFPICMGKERLKDPTHPTQKPLKLLRHLIKVASNEDDIVYDPFMGVGSTGVAAKELGRKFIGVELEKHYFDASKIRIKNTKKLKISND